MSLGEQVKMVIFSVISLTSCGGREMKKVCM